MKFKIAEIIVKERLRKVDENKVKELAESIKEIGLLNPISINAKNELVAGNHRLEACKLLGFNEIDSNIVDIDGLMAELAEIDENLIRNELHYIDRGNHLARRKEIYEELHPDTKKGATNQYTKEVLKTESDLSKNSFVKDVSFKTGKSETVIKEELQIAKNILPEVQEIIKEKEITKTEALQVSRMKPEEQRQIAEKLQEKPTVKEAVREIKKEEKQKEKNLILEKVTETWTDENIQIKLGDSFELIKQVDSESIDLVLTDLPYNQSKENNFTTMGRQGIDFGEWDHIADYKKFLSDIVLDLERVLKQSGSFYIFTNAIHISNLWETLERNGLNPKRVMVWEKTNPIPTNQDRLFLSASEFFIWGTKGDKWKFNSEYESNVVKFPTITDSKNRFHPTQKPEQLFEKLINISSNPGDLILDPFSGSGTTAVCCKNNKRNFLGFELDKSYYSQSIDRLAGV